MKSFYYYVNFKLIPEFFERRPNAFFKEMCQGGVAHWANVYEYIYGLALQKGDVPCERKFSPDEFAIDDMDMGDGKYVLVITLPKPADFESHEMMLCHAYAIPYIKTETTIQPQKLYTVEQSVFSKDDFLSGLFGEDAYFIGSMTRQGHVTHRSVSGHPEAIATVVSELAFRS